jgi:biopolymer transport protein ExbB
MDMPELDQVMTPLADARELLALGGAAIWVIAALSVIAVALILWKLWRFVRMGVWSGRRSRAALGLWLDGQDTEALREVAAARGLRARLVHAAIAACRDPRMTPIAAEAETERVARALLAEARGGLRPLDLIATIAPLLGLLGTVLGMIEAFRALQEAGAGADPAALAGGIWEALLTTAAGMAVAIVASVALSWFDGILETLRHDMEDLATRILLRPVAGAPARPRLVGK